MTYLLDVSTLLAFLWQTHAFHQRASGWLEGKKLAAETPLEYIEGDDV